MNPADTKELVLHHGAVGVHSYSEEETAAFSNHFNTYLSGQQYTRRSESQVRSATVSALQFTLTIEPLDFVCLLTCLHNRR